MVAQLLIAVDEAGVGTDEFWDGAEGHPVHCFVVEVGFHDDELLQGCNLLQF